MTGSDDRKTRTSERLAAIRERFSLGLEDKLAELSRLALAASGDGRAEAAAACENLRLGLHNLSGSAPTLGFVALGRRAATLEAVVTAERRPNGTLPPAVASSLAEDIVRLVDARD